VRARACENECSVLFGRLNRAPPPHTHTHPHAHTHTHTYCQLLWRTRSSASLRGVRVIYLPLRCAELVVFVFVNEIKREVNLVEIEDVPCRCCNEAVNCNASCEQVA
jgi:hypothetical protein